MLAPRFHGSDEPVFALVNCVVKEAVGVTPPTKTSNHAWLVSLSPQHHRDEAASHPWLADFDAGPVRVGTVQSTVLAQQSLYLCRWWSFVNHPVIAFIESLMVQVAHAWRLCELRFNHLL